MSQIPMDDGVVLRADVFRPDRRRPLPGDPELRPVREGAPVPGGLSERLEADGGRAPRRRRRLDEQVPELGGRRPGEVGAGRLRRASASTRAAPAARPGTSTTSRRARPGTSTTASSGPASQAWSNGKVGLNGISYYAINQWQVAVAPAAAPRGDVRLGGRRRLVPRHDPPRRDPLHLLAPTGTTCRSRRVQYGLGERGPRKPETGELVCGDETLSDEELAANRADFGAEILGPPARRRLPPGALAGLGQDHRAALVRRQLGRPGPPPPRQLRGLLRAASEQKWLEVHGIEHWTHFYTDYGRELQMRFFDHLPEGRGHGWASQPRVYLQRPPRRASGSSCASEEDWPIPRTRWTNLYLDPDGERLRRNAAGEPGRSSTTRWGTGSRSRCPPLEDELEFTGPVAAKLWVSSSTEDADLFLVLRVFDPEGEEVTFQRRDRPAHADRHRAGCAPRTASSIPS